MKAYERLNVEVVKFEAQDVITASVAECVCKDWDSCPGYQQNHRNYRTGEVCPGDENGKHGCAVN